MISVEVA